MKSTFRQHLLALSDILDGTSIHVASPDEVVYRREYENDAVAQYSPVHGLDSRIGARRPESEDPQDDQEDQGNDVDSQASSAQVELAGEKGLAPDSLECNARDGDDVGGDHGSGSERHDLHIRDGRAELNKRKDGDEDDCDVDGVYRDLEARRNGSEDTGERETLITGEGEELARVGGHDGNAGENSDGQHHDCQDSGPGGRSSRVEEDLHEADAEGSC
jgi:hypothetical protein